MRTCKHTIFPNMEVIPCPHGLLYEHKIHETFKQWIIKKLAKFFAILALSLATIPILILLLLAKIDKKSVLYALEEVK